MEKKKKSISDFPFEMIFFLPEFCPLESPPAKTDGVLVFCFWSDNAFYFAIVPERQFQWIFYFKADSYFLPVNWR